MNKGLEKFFEKKENYDTHLPERMKHVVTGEVKHILRELDVKTIFSQAIFDYEKSGDELKTTVYLDKDKDDMKNVFMSLVERVFKNQDSYSWIWASYGETNDYDLSTLDENKVFES